MATGSALIWDDDGNRFFETGVDKGVLYPFTSGAYENGVAWNGLTSFSDSPEGGEPNDLYADNIKYLSIMSTENFNFSIEAYTYPEEFGECDGSKQAVAGAFVGQQPRKKFGFVCRTKIGNDVDGVDKGYKLHICYGCLASPSEKSYETINDSPEAITFSWDITTTPVKFNPTGSYATLKPTAHIVIDSTKADATKLAALEDTLFGKDNTNDATLPTPDAVLAALA